VILFHITRRQHIESIVFQGLRGDPEGGGFLYPDTARANVRDALRRELGFTPVWLTDDPVWLAENQCTRCWQEIHDAHLIAVDVDEGSVIDYDDVRDRIYWCAPKGEDRRFSEFLSPAIPPERVRLLGRFRS